MNKPSILTPAAHVTWKTGPNEPVHWPTLARELNFPGTAPVLVALSGGADSVYLLDLVRRAEGAPEIRVAHINHQLRGAHSDGDEEFCGELCRDWGLPFQAHKVQLDPNGNDLERRARELRYGALGKIAGQHHIDWVLTAHHRDDVLETLLMRWMRGSSLPGMAGMQGHSAFPLATGAVRPLHLIRPLLSFGCEEIRASLRSRGIPWREDSSNQSGRFTRNRVRHQLLPLLRANCGEDIVADLTRFQRTLVQHESLLEKRMPELRWQPRRRGQRNTWRMDRAPLCLPPALLLERALYKSLLAHTGRPPKDTVLNAMGQCLSRGTTGHWNLRGGWGLALEPLFLRLVAPSR